MSRHTPKAVWEMASAREFNELLAERGTLLSDLSEVKLALANTLAERDELVAALADLLAAEKLDDWEPRLVGARERARATLAKVAKP
jgi:hypothetical protein